MAAVSIPPSPHTLSKMANRRVPLSSIPNAANSPFRAVALAASNRSRIQANNAEDGSHDEAPPAKKHIVEVNRSNPRTPPPRRQVQPVEGRVFNRRPQDSQLTDFDKKLLAVKDKAAQGKDVKSERVPNEVMDNLRQWQKHYTKVFPSFVFYFESVSDEARKQCTKQLYTFGAVSSSHIPVATSLPCTLICFATERREVFLQRRHPYCHHTVSS